MKTKCKKIDILLNRLLYSIYFIGHSLDSWCSRSISIFVDMTFGKLLYSIPFVRKHINKTYGAETFEKCRERKNALLLEYSKRSSIPYRSIFFYPFTLLLFCLPIYLMINCWTLCGKYAWIFVHHTNVLISDSFIIVPLLLSVTMSESFFWRNDRYLKFFATFKKEKPPKVIIWATGIGTLMFIILLFIANLAIMEYADTIYNIHHH